MKINQKVLIFNGYSPDKYTGKGKYLDYLFHRYKHRHYISHTWNLLNYIHPKATYLFRGIDIFLLYLPKALLCMLFYRYVLRQKPLLVIDSQDNLFLVKYFKLLHISPDVLVFYDFGSPEGVCVHYRHELLSVGKIVVMTSYIAHRLIAQIGDAARNKVEVIPYRISREWLSLHRSKFQLPSQYILYVGSEQNRKNLFTVLRAFEKVLLHYPSLYFVKVGTHQSTRNRAKLVEILSQKPNLKQRFVLMEETSNNDIAAIYQNAFLLVFPSTYEGFGIPLVEAMAKKVPILASDIPTSREICADAAEYITEPYNVELWHKAIVRFITDKKYYQNKSSKAGERSQQFIIK